jgi:hypothetical protein
MASLSFPESLEESWSDTLDLLTLTCSSLKARTNFEYVYKKLDTVLESLWRCDSHVTIYLTEHEDELMDLLDTFMELLFRARNYAELLIIVNKINVDPSEIPALCETCDRCISGIRCTDLEENTDGERDALRLEHRLCYIMSAYDYMEHGRAVKTDANIKEIEDLFSDNDELREIFLSAFK